MLEVIVYAVRDSYCIECRSRGNDTCPFDDGCEEYRSMVNAASRAVLSFAKLIQDEAVWKVPGLLRDTISELENRP